MSGQPVKPAGFFFKIVGRPGLRSVSCILYFRHSDGRWSWVTERGRGNDTGSASLPSEVFLELVERLSAAPSTDYDDEQLSKVRADLRHELTTSR